MGERRTQIPPLLIVTAAYVRHQMLDIEYLIFLCFSRSASMMNLCFGLVTIFLILDVASTDNGSKDKNSNEVQHGLSVVHNVFLQSSENDENNNPFFSLQAANYNYNPFPNRYNNPFLNPGSVSKVNTPSSSPKPSTLPYYPTISNTPLTLFATPASVNEDVTSRSPTSYIDLKDSVQDAFPNKFNFVKTVSERKCQQYIEDIAGVTWIAPLVGKERPIKVVKNCEGTVNNLVVNGSKTHVGEFPHMVALGILNPKFSLMCGGTLISHTWVLTAAHCTHGANNGATHARIGFQKLTDEAGLTIAIKDTIRHQEYHSPELYADIGLVKLADSVQFGRFIRPACLYQEYDKMPRQAWVSGWGNTEFTGDLSDDLLKAELDLVTNYACTLKHNASDLVSHGITPSMICAGGGDKDTCQGDSGGPLQIVHPTSKCLFQIIGITSFGQSCASSIPGVYTRVSHYLQWIEDIVWPEEQQL